MRGGRIIGWTMLAALVTTPAWQAEAKRQAPPRMVAPAHPRFIPMAGGRNFRDIGGYRTTDGRVVRWGVMYRSGSMGNLAPEGRMMLAGLHPAAIVDLRMPAERARDDGWVEARPGYWTRDYAMSLGNLANPFQGKPTPGSMRAMMMGAYARLPIEQAPSYKVLFAKLIGGEAPVVVNCTAGKDRTGIAAALVLIALGVPYPTVRDDFLLSNGAPGMETLQGSLGQMALPPAVARPLVEVEPGYLDTAFTAIRAKYGSIDAYLAKELGVGPRQKAALRQRMLK